jgi:hypothetical protein
VIVQVWLAVSIHAMGEGNNAFPPCLVLAIVTVSPIAHDERSILQIVHRRAHGRAVRVDDASRVEGIDRKIRS